MTGQAYLMRGLPILLQLLICHFICCTVFISLPGQEVTPGPLLHYLRNIPCEYSNISCAWAANKILLCLYPFSII